LIKEITQVASPSSKKVSGKTGGSTKKSPVKKAAKKKVVKKTAAATTVKKKVVKKAAAPRKRAPAGGKVSESTLRRIDPRERYEMIAKMAYFRAEKRGFESGWEVEDWLESERLVDEMLDKM
jgi:hypothetical protein